MIPCSRILVCSCLPSLSTQKKVIRSLLRLQSTRHDHHKNTAQYHEPENSNNKLPHHQSIQMPEKSRMQQTRFYPRSIPTTRWCVISHLWYHLLHCANTRKMCHTRDQSNERCIDHPPHVEKARYLIVSCLPRKPWTSQPRANDSWAKEHLAHPLSCRVMNPSKATCHQVKCACPGLIAPFLASARYVSHAAWPRQAPDCQIRVPDASLRPMHLYPFSTVAQCLNESPINSRVATLVAPPSSL